MFTSRLAIISVSIMNNYEDPNQIDNSLEMSDAPKSPTTDIIGLDNEVHYPEDETPPGTKKAPKKLSFSKKLWHEINVYLLIFVVLIAATAAIFVVSYMNSKKALETPATAIQDLTQAQLAEIAAGDASVGDPRYTLNVQSDAVFAGNGLFRGDLNVAGNLQVAKPLSVTAIVVSGTSNLTNVQAETLSVANSLTVQGKVTILSSSIIRDNLTVGGAMRVDGTLSATKISTGNLELTGNSSLTVGGHLGTGGTNPSRANGGALGAGGTSSVSGNDITGTININTGTGTVAGCYTTITFVTPFSSTPSVMITPVGDSAAEIRYYVNRSGTSFSVCSTNAAPTSRSFSFDYFVVN